LHVALGRHGEAHDRVRGFQSAGEHGDLRGAGRFRIVILPAAGKAQGQREEEEEEFQISS
jgi:hypothetical protein